MTKFIHLILSFSTILIFSTNCSTQDLDALGTIDFPVSGSEEARSYFEQGVKLLHSFEYSDSATAFRKAQEIDSDMVMAYWGEAMTQNHPIWNQQDREAALTILEKIGASPAERALKAKTQKERDFLETAEILYGEGSKEERDDRFESAMASLSTKYPEDHEAKTFHALAILGSCQGTRDFRKYMKAGALALEVFEENPTHPGAAHYAVHSFDDPIHAPLGLEAAESYASIAPDAAHALHMPSHIFMALGLWEESNATNVKSKAAANKKGRPGLHAAWWLTYGFIQSGQIDLAKAEIMDLRMKVEEGGSRSMNNHLAYMLAHFMHEFTSELPRSVADVLDRGNLSVMSEANLVFAEALVAASNDASFEKEAERIKVLSKKEDGYSKIDEIGIMQLQLKALEAWKGGRGEDAFVILEAAVKLHESMAVEFGPPTPVKPLYEFFGDLLLENDKLAEAKKMYEASLLDKPGRRQTVAALASIATRLEDKKAEIQHSCYLSDILKNADARFTEEKKACAMSKL